MWKFAIVIEEASVDPTPDFSGRAEVLVERTSRGRDQSRRRFLEDSLLSLFSPNHESFGRYLAVSVKNNGWGSAKNATLVLENSYLNEIVPVSDRTLLTTIESGAAETFKIDGETINETSFVRLKDHLASKARDEMNASLQRDFESWFSYEKQRRRYDEAERRRDEKSQWQPEPFEYDVAYKKFFVAKRRGVLS
jgi:hypothetical protein